MSERGDIALLIYSAILLCKLRAASAALSRGVPAVQAAGGKAALLVPSSGSPPILGSSIPTHLWWTVPSYGTFLYDATRPGMLLPGRVLSTLHIVVGSSGVATLRRKLRAATLFPGV